MPSAIIARIDIDAYNLSLEVNYLNSLQKIPESYDEFGQGYWKNISLYNSTGEPGDTLYQIASACRPTPHLASCPEINRLILDNFRLDNLKMVRARSLIDGMVIPDRDFVELTPKYIDETIHAASKIISRRTLKDLIFALSKYHFTYDIPILACYDWIVDAALLAGDRDTAEKARSLKRYLVEHRHLNERFTING